MEGKRVDFAFRTIGDIVGPLLGTFVVGTADTTKLGCIDDGADEVGVLVVGFFVGQVVAISAPLKEKSSSN